MLNYSWSESFSVGDPTLDAHHQTLLTMFNEISTLLTMKDNTEALLQLVLKLKAYTIHHFSAEEKRMEAVNYPNIDAHKEQHKTFIHKIERSYQDINDHPSEVTEDLFIFLSQWLITHIQQDDQAYKGMI